MSDLVPLYTLELRANFLGLFIINSYHVLFPACSKGTAVFFVIDSQNVIVTFTCMEDFFAILANVLINVPIGICHE